jgi:hypothetical protein
MPGPFAPEPSLLDSLPSSGPPKKQRTWLIVLVIILALMLVGIVSCVALVGTTGKAVNKSMAEASQSQRAEGDRNTRREVTPGKAFTIGKHETLAGWRAQKVTIFDDTEFNVTGKVKNVSDATSTAFIHPKFIDSSGESPRQRVMPLRWPGGRPDSSPYLHLRRRLWQYKRVTAEADF